MQGVASRTAELSPLGCYVEVQEAEGWNQDEESRPTRRIARAEAHESRVGFRAVFRTSPAEPVRKNSTIGKPARDLLAGSWSINGRRLFFHVGREAQSDVWVVDNFDPDLPPQEP